MDFYTFKNRWKQKNKTREKLDIDEKTIFVDINEKPQTQRQIILYYYFLFIKDILEDIKAKEILEIGCGRGTMSLYIKRYMGLNVSLLDNETGALKIAKREFKKKKLNAEYHLSDALKTELKANKFDAIISIGLAEHIDDVESLFREQYRLLKKGGVAISLNVPKKISIQFFNLIFRFFKKVFGNYHESITKDYYRNSLKPNDFKKISEIAGFKKIKITHVCPFPTYTPIKLKNDKKIAKLNRFILKIRGLFMKYPYKTNYLFSQSHFLVGYKE